MQTYSYLFSPSRRKFNQTTNAVQTNDSKYLWRAACCRFLDFLTFLNSFRQILLCNLTIYPWGSIYIIINSLQRLRLSHTYIYIQYLRTLQIVHQPIQCDTRLKPVSHYGCTLSQNAAKSLSHLICKMVIHLFFCFLVANIFKTG